MIKIRPVTLISFFIVVCIAIISLINSLRWINEPFAGFFFMKNSIVASSGLSRWPGTKDGKIFQAKIIEVEGQKVQNSEQIKEIIQKKSVGDNISYLFFKDNQLFSRRIPLINFMYIDFLLIFGIYILNGLIYAFVGISVYHLKPDMSASKALFIFCLISSLFGLTACDLYSPYWFFRFHVIFEAFLPATLIHSVLTFPEKKSIIHKHPSILFSPYLISFIASIFYEIFLYSHSGYVLIHNFSVFYLGTAAVVFMIFSASTYLKTESALIKQKIRVVILGSGIAFFIPAVIMITSAITKGEIALNTIGFTAFIFPVALGYATVKHNLFEVDVVIQRSLYYLSLTTLIIIIYFGMIISFNIVFYSSNVVGDVIKSPVVSLFFIIFILLLLNPLKERAQRIVDRLFYRINYDYRTIIEKVSSDLTTLLNLEEITERIVQTLSEVLFAERCLVVLREPKVNEYCVFKSKGFDGNGWENLRINQNHPLIERIRQKKREITYYDFEQGNEDQPIRGAELEVLNQLQAQLILPIFFKEELEGLLILGRKKSGIFYTAEDLGLLKILATEGAISIANARSYEEIQQLNFNLEDKVKQRTEELNSSNQKLLESLIKLQELDSLKSKFLSNVSHELRTPLTLNLTPISSILREEIGKLNQEQKSYLEVIYRNSLILLRLINDLLDIAKIEAGSMRLNLQRTDIVAFTRKIIDYVRPAAEQRGIPIELNAPPSALPLEIYFDPGKLEKVFLNLLSNALKFTSRNGKIRVDFLEDHQGVYIGFMDTGIGIPETALEKIFDRFYQVEDADSRRNQGTGIGLALAKELVDLHQGEISVKSKVGEGTTFTIKLLKGFDHFPSDQRKVEIAETEGSYQIQGEIPMEIMVPSEEPYSFSSEGEISGEGRDIRHKLLVVEDNREMAKIIISFLQDKYKVLWAQDGAAGLEMARKEEPDLIISDVMMPVKDGYQLCKEIKEDEKLRFTPVILLTAREDMVSKIEGLESGANDYLLKPFDSRELLARVKSLLNLRALEKELYKSYHEIQKTHQELKATQVQLLHSAKMSSLGQLVAGVAHELNNPLSFVYGNLHFLKEYANNVKEALQALVGLNFSHSEDLEKIKKLREEFSLDYILADLDEVVKGCYEGAQRAKEIVQDLRTFSRSDEAEAKRIDIHQTMNTTLKFLGKTYKNKITLHLDYGDIPKIECYAGQLNQVFMNILSNAADAIQGKGDVWISTRLLDEWVEIKIKDNGIGIPSEHLDKIFDPFFTTKEVGKGTGLGLSISYGIIQKHGGNIQVDSQVGVGTTVTIQLPMKITSQSLICA